MNIESHIPLINNVLGDWRESIGADFNAYKNHVCRVVNFCFNLRQCSKDEMEKIIIAACFHDLGIWTNQTFDYLKPSIELAKKYLSNNNLENWGNEIELMINMHHKITTFKNQAYPLVEVFRKADWIDVSKGIRHFGLTKAVIGKIMAKFPNLGFHKRLVQLTKKEFKRNPLKPLPMMRW
jgi:hypothetical protein